jgi:hypothetical protein
MVVGASAERIYPAENCGMERYHWSAHAISFSIMYSRKRGTCTNRDRMVVVEVVPDMMRLECPHRLAPTKRGDASDSSGRFLINHTHQGAALAQHECAWDSVKKTSEIASVNASFEIQVVKNVFIVLSISTC